MAEHLYPSPLASLADLLRTPVSAKQPYDSAFHLIGGLSIIIPYLLALASQMMSKVSLIILSGISRSPWSIAPKLFAYR
jgi:hypothetical protein